MSNATPATKDNAAPATALTAAYASRSSAQSAALRLARAESLTGCVPMSHLLPGIYQGEGATAAYEVRPGQIDWFVVVVPADELARRLQVNIRREVDRILDLAAFSAKRAKELRELGKPAGNCFVRMHERLVAEYRDQARELETQLTVSAVRAEVA